MRVLAICAAFLAAACAPEPAPPVSNGEEAPLECVAFACQQAATRETTITDAFGALLIGLQISALPEGAAPLGEYGCPGQRPHRPGAVSGVDDEETCAFVLDDVVYFLDFANRVHSKTIYVTPGRFAYHVWPSGRPLPFGLRGDETLEQAKANVEAQIGGVMEVVPVTSGAWLRVASSTNHTAEPVHTVLAFSDEGRLEAIWIAASTERRRRDDYRR